MYWERVSPQNTGPFRVHDASMEGALLDLRSRLARTLVPVTVVGAKLRNGGPSSSSSSSSRSSFPHRPTAIGPTCSTSPALPATTALDATPLQTSCGDGIESTTSICVHTTLFQCRTIYNYIVDSSGSFSATLVSR